MPLAKEYTSAANDDAPEAANESRFFPIVTDHLGTPKEMYTAEGECVWSANHTLWGECKVTRQGYVKPQNELQEYINPEEQKVDCDLRFANQWEDEESGLYYNLHRYYDPHSGQYASIDPIGLMGGLRTHGYVENPTTWVDPLGLAGCPDYFEKLTKEQQKVMKDVLERASTGKVGKKHGHIEDIKRTIDILQNPKEVFASQGKSGRLIFHDGENVVVVGTQGSEKGWGVTDYGPAGSAERVPVGSEPTTPRGNVVTSDDIVNGTIPSKSGNLPAGDSIWKSSP